MAPFPLVIHLFVLSYYTRFFLSLRVFFIANPKSAIQRLNG
ncbi:hypothetical protein HMPREF0083_02124 [Aneurinibacillus aneurinilyticus ATCC 12856]|uniref:Uncharacterized protein n=1 Tax=Aneurinibacillus aneurinilyticus ATCC 12856 TaxID=649747 RepID=U1X477_ANEAE|nr:hypothetical protein HMPREF0083_02124 [Aneurinibacillus aneurinilyticus ATCC 12856]